MRNPVNGESFTSPYFKAGEISICLPLYRDSGQNEYAR